jgi:hypothetical protein
MDINSSKATSKVVEKVIDHLKTSERAMYSKMGGFELNIGPASDSKYAIDAFASRSPVAVGDANWIGEDVVTPQSESAFKAGKAVFANRWNSSTLKYDRHIYDQRMVGDAAPDLIGAQLLSPAMVNYFNQPFKKPLSWSQAGKLVSIQTGTNPWASVMSLSLVDYSGFGAIAAAGALNNTMTQDVEVSTGLMTSAIINYDVTYKLTVEEQAMSSTNVFPFSGQQIAQKQTYANYVSRLIRDYLVYFGNANTATLGLLNAVTPTSWSGGSLSSIAAGASTTKGSDMVQLVMNAIRTFMTNSDNKFNSVKMAMSPLAYNILNSTVYSSNYNPQSPMQTIKQNFEAGAGPGGVKPTIEFIADPMLKASTTFNGQVYDYMVLASPDIDGGPDFGSQPTLLFGQPLIDFVYPVVPGQYNTQYKTLSRVAGVFAPYTPALAVYTGFGV